MRILFIILIVIIPFYNYSQQSFEQEGLASFYADKFEGRTTANGEIYEHSKKTAAHLTLPFNTFVKVTNLENSKSVVLRVNDRGPFIKGRIIDVSQSAAEELDFIETGLVNVKVEVVEYEEEIKTLDEQSIKEFGTAVEGADMSSIESENPYYSFDVKVIQPKGYGIQIGSFKEMENLARLTERLQSKYKKEVIVEVSQAKNSKLYRIIIGTFSSREEALNYSSNFAREFPDCFVVKF
ncbi:septal ring lytic transglycosylase RlpA family protein [Bacteroidota bacterium]